MKKISHLLLLVIVAVSLQSCVLIYSNFDFFSEAKPLEEVTLEGDGKARILMIDVNGEILNEAEQGLFGMSLHEPQVVVMEEQLKMAMENSKIKAVLIRINSPGGSVTASDLLYRQLKTFREKTQLPVYVMMMDVAASGGYYIAMAGDKVYASPTTVTGSIGVIMLNLSFEGLMKKVGVASKVVKSGENKDIGSPFKDMTPEERKILQSIIDDLYQGFVDVVAAGRPQLTREAILKAADGRVYTAKQAKDLGLIDGITYLPDLVEQIKNEQKLESVRVVTYRRPAEGMSNNIYSQMQRPLPKGMSLIDPALTKNLAHGMSGPGFYYLWAPGTN